MLKSNTEKNFQSSASSGNREYFRNITCLKFLLTPIFTDNVISEKVKGNFHFLNTLSSGKYFWRLTPFYSLGNIGYIKNNKYQPFEIIQTTALEPVQLVFPPNNTEISTIESSKG